MHFYRILNISIIQLGRELRVHDWPQERCANIRLLHPGQTSCDHNNTSKSPEVPGNKDTEERGVVSDDDGVNNE